ncbi:MAG: hypothetical protein EAY65_07045 [Alphaproteobacteria bacterium]|nr:MAG: hypothetical protein EAY65_07045 [Alphaproteobacteria bacterium]
MTLLNHIATHQKELLALAARYGVSNIRVVGSVARREEREDSDIDLLVDFDVSVAGGLAIGGFQYDASELLGRRVDIIMSGGKIRPRIMEQFMMDAVPINDGGVG